MQDLIVQYFKKMYVGNSEISGQGLFAGEPISKGELILSFGGVLVSTAERYTGKYLRSTFVGITDSIALCEEIESNKDFSDYINHSCAPNAGMCDCITIMAIKDIAKDEEICCDYAFWESNEDWILKMPCSCGSSCCRHIITGLDWKNVSSTNEMFRYYSPFIKRRIIKNER